MNEATLLNFEFLQTYFGLQSQEMTEVKVVQVWGYYKLNVSAREFVPSVKG